MPPHQREVLEHAEGHPSTVFCPRGYLTQAEPLLLLALRIREETLGPQHPHVASSLFALAKLYITQGQYTKAEPLFQRALTIREQQLGSEHPETVATSNAYASLLMSMDRE